MSRISDFSDTSALAEAKRLGGVILARRTKLDTWLGVPAPSVPAHFSEDSGFFSGMLSLFRYARGEDVPAAIVRDFIDDLLELLFCGLASPNMALPSFSSMEDRPWAHAWRAAELRLVIDEGEDVETPTLAHLLRIPSHTLAHYLMRNGMAPSYVPGSHLSEVCAFFSKPIDERCEHITPILEAVTDDSSDE